MGSLRAFASVVPSPSKVTELWVALLTWAVLSTCPKLHLGPSFTCLAPVDLYAQFLTPAPLQASLIEQKLPLIRSTECSRHALLAETPADQTAPGRLGQCSHNCQSLQNLETVGEAAWPLMLAAYSKSFKSSEQPKSAGWVASRLPAKRAAPKTQSHTDPASGSSISRASLYLDTGPSAQHTGGTDRSNRCPRLSSSLL